MEIGNITRTLHTVSLITVLLAVCPSQAFGQTREELRQKAVLLQSRVDSLADVLSGLRDRYSSVPSEREEIAVQLQNVEPELYSAKRELDNYSQYLVGNDTDRSSGTDTHHPSRSLGSFVALSVTQSQLSMFMEAQKADGRTLSLAMEQVRRNEMLAGISQAYSVAETEDDALKLSDQFSSICAQMSSTDSTIAETWGTAFDNKSYIYSLAIEKQGDNGILSEIDAAMSKAEIAIKEAQGRYFSDAVATYCIQRQAMLGCEARIAERFCSPSVRDSLLGAAKTMQTMALLKPRISLPERSFIEYEPIKVVKPLAYNTKNPIPPVTIYSRGVIYRILIGAFVQSPAIALFKYHTPLFKSRDIYPRKYTYFIGGFRTEAEAEENLERLRKSGFRNPKIVVWADGVYYDTMEAWHMAEKYSLEIWNVDELPTQVSDILAQYPDVVVSKAGNCFIIDSFKPLSSAEAMASRLRIASPKLDIRTIKKQ